MLFSKRALTSSLVLSLLASAGLCMPSDPVGGNRTTVDCPAGFNGPNWQTLVEGDTALSLSRKFNTSTLWIQRLNCGGTDCNDQFKPGVQVCIPPSCVTYRVSPYDKCQNIPEYFGVIGGLGGFFAYNPDIHNPTCDNMLGESNVCIGPPQVSTSCNPNPTSPTGKQTRDLLSNRRTTIPPAIHCTKEYTAVSGDTCDRIAGKFGLIKDTSNYFYNLNPVVRNPKCDNIRVGQVYCVGDHTTA